MEGKPLHYDGSHPVSNDGEGMQEPFVLTEEMRSISGNPYGTEE
ncbi:hypothetical protein [Rossellomorea marisflavi]